MSKFGLYPCCVRRITVDGICYVCSVRNGTDMLVYKEKTLIFRLRLSPPQTWEINLYRPRTAAIIIGYFSPRGVQKGILLLSNEKELLSRLRAETEL